MTARAERVIGRKTRSTPCGKSSLSPVDHVPPFLRAPAVSDDLRVAQNNVRRKNAPPSLESADREHEEGTPGCASPLGHTPSSHIVERWKSYGSDVQGVDRPHHNSTEALECRVRPAAGSHTKGLGEVARAKTVRECWGLPAARTRAMGQKSGAGFWRVAAGSTGARGQSRGRGLSRANDFFCGVSSHAPSVKRRAMVAPHRSTHLPRGCRHTP